MIRLVIDIYIWVLIIDIILSYLPQFRREAWRVNIKRAADLTCSPIRKLLPQDLPFDFSPMIVVVLLKLFIFLF